MEKDVRIFNIYHTNCPIYKNDFVEPLLVGNKDVPEIDLKVRDYYPEISNLNRIYNENEAQYFIWKQVNSEIKGQFQYSCQLNLSKDRIKEILKDHSFIVFPITDFPEKNLYRQYVNCHPSVDLNLIIEIVKSYYPEYFNSEEKWLNFNILFSRNIYIAKNADYNKYMEFAWPVIQEFLNKRNFKSVEDAIEYYRNLNGVIRKDQERCLGFLTERLFTWYVLQNYDLNDIYQIKSNEYKYFEKLTDK